MPESGIGGRKRLLCLLALVATFSVVAMSSSLTWPILAESLRHQGYDETAIGLNAAAQFAGIMFVAGSATWLIPRLGFFRAALLGLALVAAMLATLPAVRDYWVWLALRFVLGIGNSLLFTAGDTWINHIVENRVRGRWMGIYNTAGMAGWAAGPILGSQMDPNTFGPFLAGLGGIAVAFAFLLPARRIDVHLRAAREARAPLVSLLAVFVIAPTVLLSSGMFGVVEGGIQSFAHLYTMDVLGADYRATGYVSGPATCPEGLLFEESEARLLAAAPEMLEALKAACSEMEIWEWPEGEENATCGRRRAFLLTCAAIDKAEGKA